MCQTKQTLRDAVDTAKLHISLSTSSAAFQEAFKSYLGVIQPSICKYQHHQGNSVEESELLERYQIEIAILHLLTRSLSLVSQIDYSVWPLYADKTVYSWYQLPTDVENTIEFIKRDFISNNTSSMDISVWVGELLDTTSKRYLGEFYTPPSIVEHLLSLANFNPEDIIKGKKFVDPACGGGIILTAVVKKILDYALQKTIPPKLVLEAISDRIYGFDIQPFAISLSRTLLFYLCKDILHYTKFGYQNLFRNICLEDPLTNHSKYWTDEHIGLFQYLPNDTGFDYIIGNPPFMSVKRDRLDFLTKYKEVLHGHPNLYQLFLWWAIRATKESGNVCFIVPQSMLAGSYFKNLRRELDRKVTLTDLTRMIDRKGIIGDADLQMMILSFKVNGCAEQPNKENSVNIRVTNNGEDLAKATPTNVSYSKIAYKINDLPVFWIVSNKTLDYEICEIMETRSCRIDQLNQIFAWGNGSYVWNQHKELLCTKPEVNTLPLISAASIGLYGFTFPYIGSHASRKRSFSILNNSVSSKVHSHPAILIQRTTPRKVGRRIVAGMPNKDFHQEFPSYFLENHVNYIKSINDNNDLLYGLLGWINSDATNFIFQIRNGSSLVSLYEIGLLPVNLEIVKSLVDKTKAVCSAKDATRKQLIEEQNIQIFDYLELERQHRLRIKTVLGWKDGASAS